MTLLKDIYEEKSIPTISNKDIERAKEYQETLDKIKDTTDNLTEEEYKDEFFKYEKVKEEKEEVLDQLKKLYKLYTNNKDLLDIREFKEKLFKKHQLYLELKKAEDTYENSLMNEESQIGPYAYDIADELQKKFKNEKNIHEDYHSIALEIVGWVLTSNSILNAIGVIAGKLIKKYNISKGENTVNKISKITRDIEEIFLYPIKQVIRKFTKNAKVVNFVSEIIYGLVLIALGSEVGMAAANKFRAAKYMKSAMKAIKAAAKGRDISIIIKKIKAGLKKNAEQK